MSYINSHLHKQEKILYRGKIHWIVFLFPFVCTVVWWYFSKNWAWWILLLPTWLYYLCQYIFSEMVVTNQRLIAKYGMIAVETASMELAAIEGVRTSISILGRLLGYGTLLACGKGGKNIGIPKLCQPEDFQNALYEALKADK